MKQRASGEKAEVKRREIIPLSVIPGGLAEFRDGKAYFGWRPGQCMDRDQDGEVHN